MLTLKLLIGLTVLTAGAELLVRSASALALALRISPLVVGLTVVAYGTGAPELVVSVQSVLRDQASLAVGNVVGSNLLNILVILGLSALIIPLTVSQKLVQLEVPLLIVLSVLVMVLSLDGHLSQIEGALLTFGLLVYSTWIVTRSRREQSAIKQEYADEFQVGPRWQHPAFNIALLVVGLAMLVWGSRWFTDAAVLLARSWGISELVIGLTIVAGGTSLPELATSLMAAFRGERDIAVGNVIGSNLFNIMGVMGVSGSLSKTGIMVPQEALRFDFPVMIAAAVACLPIFFTGHRISRLEGGVLFGGYCAYTLFLFLAETNPDLSRTFASMMLGFVLPLTAIGILVSVVQAVRSSSHSDSSAE